ncbi:MAG: AAA family ATPase, partial [Oscillospiraceae bacterium]|nr:AAA family ATPase [Oscillospiraceae bacterium]
MTTHISIRLAWHNDGWNGHICKKPCENTYCIGQHSYPGALINESRDLDYEKLHAGEPICNHPCKIACSLSANAFGSDSVIANINPPDFWNGIGDSIKLTLPPYTACTWCYEEMYGPKVIDNGHPNYDKRLSYAKEYFSQFEENKSLVFYYSGFSNPFSEEDADCYVVTGISRIKKIDDFYFYENTNDDIRKRYAGGFAWQKPITSNYPDEGFCIPYWKYMNNEEIIRRLVIKPSNTSSFKYGSRAVSNDDAIEIVNQLLKSVDVLIEIEDKTENWEIRRDWLNGLLNELWKARGPFPGFTSVLSTLKLNCLIQKYISLTTNEDMKKFYVELIDFLSGQKEKVFDLEITNAKIVRREYQRLEDYEQELLLKILPRFALTKEQVATIISEDRGNYSITSSIKDIVENPYIICEEYIGIDSDDSIPFYKIDNGVISSPEYGLNDLLDSGSTERLRALCVDELNRIAAHSFGKAETVISFINTRLDRMPEWKRYSYKVRDLLIEKEIIEKSLFIRKCDNNELYIYLKRVYEDERIIENTFKELAERPDISLKMTISKDRFKDGLRVSNSKISEVASEKYETILEKQAETCMQIFTKPICVLSGAAGTGKTTVIRAIVNNIKRVHGQGTGILLLAPTGKASERIKNQTGEESRTIHSYLASNGWINENFTFKRSGGRSGQNLNTLIIDESSMIDLNLFATLIRSINWNSVQRLILVGDPNQLPPIGRGKVFVDTISWLKKEYPDNIGILTENIRQLVNQIEENGTGILDLAELFIQEKQESDDTDKCADLKKQKEILFAKILEKGNGEIDKDLSVYFWKEQSDLNEILKTVLIKDMKSITGLREYKSSDELWKRTLRGDGNVMNPDLLQLISPYRGEFYGTDALNALMQHEFNSYWINKCEIKGITYFDKVIQFRNRPKSDMAYAYNFSTRRIEKKEVFNGEMGIVYYH